MVTKEIELGIQMLNTLIGHLPSIASCYYEEIIAIYVALMQYSPD